MKTILKTTLVLFLLIAFSCSKDDAPVQEQLQVTPPATVTNMSPTSGPKTTVVTFTGSNFGDNVNNVQVFFDDIEAPIQSITDTQIQTTVPPRTFFGEVRLVINGTEFIGFNFEYEIVDIQVSTIAGSTQGNTDGNGIDAQFNQPSGISIDALGFMYIADSFNNIIKKISPDGDVTTFAGTSEGGTLDGIGINATFGVPVSLDTDSTGNIYVADTFNDRIRKITPSGVVSTLAGSTQGFEDGTGLNAKFNNPFNLVVDALDNIYVTDTNNHKIRKITPEGIVSTISGSSEGFADGNGANAQFSQPSGIAIDSSGNIYVADKDNHKIRKINSIGDVTTIAGSTEGFEDGIGTNAKFDIPFSLTLDALDNIYVSDFFNESIRKIDSSGQVITIAGSVSGFEDGTGQNAKFAGPRGLIVDDSFTIYVADALNHKIRKITQE